MRIGRPGSHTLEAIRESCEGPEPGELPGDAEKWRLDAMNEMIPVQDKLREAENKVPVLKQESLNIQRQMTVEVG
jgi:hypothetical protein